MSVCEKCVHYKRNPLSDNWLKEDEIGECDAIPGLIDIEIKCSEWGGGAYVEKIDVPYNFSCAAFNPITNGE